MRLFPQREKRKGGGKKGGECGLSRFRPTKGLIFAACRADLGWNGRIQRSWEEGKREGKGGEREGKGGSPNLQVLLELQQLPLAPPLTGIFSDPRIGEERRGKRKKKKEGGKGGRDGGFR